MLLTRTITNDEAPTEMYQVPPSTVEFIKLGPILRDGTIQLEGMTKSDLDGTCPNAWHLPSLRKQ